VYSATSMDSNYLQLTKMYEHNLDHTAANMTYGPFGGASGERGGAPIEGRHCGRGWMQRGPNPPPSEPPSVMSEVRGPSEVAVGNALELCAY
jgi:hypothetical protein